MWEFRSSDLLSLLTQELARKAPYHIARRFWATPLTPFLSWHVRKILTPRQEPELIKNLIQSHKEKPPPPPWPGSLRTESVQMKKSSFDTHTHALSHDLLSRTGAKLVRDDSAISRGNAINSPRRAATYRTERISAAKTNAKTPKAILLHYEFITHEWHTLLCLRSADTCTNNANWLLTDCDPPYVCPMHCCLVRHWPHVKRTRRARGVGDTLMPRSKFGSVIKLLAAGGAWDTFFLGFFADRDTFLNPQRARVCDLQIKSQYHFAIRHPLPRHVVAAATRLRPIAITCLRGYL